MRFCLYKLWILQGHPLTVAFLRQFLTAHMLVQGMAFIDTDTFMLVFKYLTTLQVFKYCSLARHTCADPAYRSQRLHDLACCTSVLHLVAKILLLHAGSVPHSAIWEQDCHQPEWQRRQRCSHCSSVPEHLHGPIVAV